MESQLLAVVVPTPQLAAQLSAGLSLARLEATLLASLQAAAHANGITKSYEIPSAVVIESVPWCIRDGTLSAVGKLARGVLAAKYEVRLVNVQCIFSAIKDFTGKTVCTRSLRDCAHALHACVRL